MKTLLVFLSAFILALKVNAQISFSIHHRESCLFNDNTQAFDICDEYKENSLFVMNAAETMITHTAPTMQSTYYIKKREYDESTNVYAYMVVSDVGNEYFYFFDIANKLIKCLAIRDTDSYIILFHVKAVF